MINKDNLKQYIDKYSWGISFFLSAISMYLLLLCVGMAGNGRYLFLRGDGFEQFMGDIRMVIRSLLNGENPLYQFCVSMGFSTVLPIALEIINPFNILYLIFNKVDINTITIVIVLLKIGTIGASFHLFARKICKTDVFWSIVFSILYAMSAFPVSYGTIYIFWLDVLYIIPLCAMAVHKALYEKKITNLTIVLSYIFITQFYMGYLTGIFALLYYLLLLIFNQKRIEKNDIWRALARFAISSLNAILISAIVWIPVLFFLLKYNPSDRTMFTNLQIGLMEVINNLFWGEIQTAGRAPFIYCGISSLLLLLLFFINKRIHFSEKMIYGFLLLFYALGCFVPSVYYLLHAFDAPDGYGFRFSFLLSFIVCAIACKQIVFIKYIQRRYLFFWTFFLLGLYLLEGRFEKFELGAFSSNIGIKFAINLALFLVWIVILINFREQKKKYNFFKLFVILLAVLEMVSNAYASINAYDALEVNGTEKKDYIEWKMKYDSVMDNINRSSGQSFYRAVAFSDYLHNSDSYFGYNGVSDFCTGENEQLRHLMESLGLYTSKAETYATGITPPLEMLLSVKYELYINMNYYHPENNGKPEIKENEYWLPIGFMVSRNAIDDIPMGPNAFENQNNLFEALSGVGEIFEPVTDENLEIIEDGLIISEDRKTIERISDEGQMFFIVRNENESVFLQLEQEKKQVFGIVFMPFDNMACDSDAFVSYPITVTMKDYDDYTKYVELYSDDDFVDPLQIDNINIYRLNEEKLNDCYKVLNGNVLDVEKWENGYIKGSINVTDNNKILLTTIPMTDGWTVFINGEKMKPLGAINKTFMAIEFPDNGHYDIEFKYECPGLKLGAGISIIGIFFLGVIVVMEIIADRRNRVKD